MKLIKSKDERARDELARQLRQEASWYATRVSRKLGQLGFDHQVAAARRPSPIEALLVGRQGRQLVRFSECRANEDAIYLRIDSMRLPYRVRETDFAERWVLDALGVACYHKIDFVSSPAGGAWFRILRDQGFSGIPTEFTVRSAIETMPKTARPLVFAVGVGENRKVIYRDLAKLPHLLVAGATGTGKSVFLNSLLCTLLVRNQPDVLQVMMIDLKGGMELTDYKGVPHLMRPLVTEPEGVPQALDEFNAEIIRRQELLEGVARDLDGWNHQRPDQRLPRLLLVVDELAQVMLYLDRKVKRTSELLFGSILSKSRATGGHCILCTQRPSSDVVTGYIKANIYARMAFSCASDRDSMVIIDNSRAQGLRPEGRAIFAYGASQIEVQAPLITETQITRVCKQVRERDQDVTPAETVGFCEVLEYALDNFAGELPYRKLYHAFAGRIPQTPLERYLKSLNGQVVTVRGELYRVENGQGRRARRLVPVNALRFEPEEIPETIGG